MEKGSQLAGELLSIHRAKVIAAFVAIIVIGAGAFFYRRSVELRTDRAEIAYFRARQALDMRNFEVAEPDLRAVVTRYPGTPGGTLAALALAQALYATGRHADGIEALRDVSGRAPRDIRPEVHALMAAGHENLAQFEEAAAEYERAAEIARFPRDRLTYRAMAARAYGTAGRSEEALAIWQELEAEPTQFLANEARVRIGELSARPEG
jgi:tetratricopeptide (TPR) repeat protein